ncbi:hypothetical protein [Streptomyces boninensis]|uniref:hypothetical protein n=1 Tax=Streptomyces boninensis TaxID=2039455 RepID=UPI003B21F657
MQVLLTLGTLCGAVAAAGVLLRWLWRANRQLVRLADSLIELSPDEGEQTVREELTRLSGDLSVLSGRFDEHLDRHGGRPD